MNWIFLTSFPENCSREYGVNIYYDNKIDEIQRIQYNAVIQSSGMLENESAIKIYKENIILNENRTDDNSYELAKSCAKPLFPITILVDRQGSIVSMRIDDIIRRWEENKEHLKYFSGEEADRYIADTEAALKDREKVKLLVERDFFFLHFFKLIYGSQPDDKIKFTSALPVTPFHDPYTFDCTQSIEDDTTSGNNDMIVVQKGILTDSVAVNEITPFRYPDPGRSEANIDGQYTCRYTIGRESNLIDSIVCDYIFKTKDDVIYEVRLEAYHIAEKSIIPTEDEYIASLRPKSKQTLWERLFDS